MAQNASLNLDGIADGFDDGVVGRAARRALARHQEAYTDEVRRLLDAGLDVMRRLGTTKSPRVADIIEHAGLSRDAFYRHFASKEELVAAIVEAGTWRLVSYADHRMQKAVSPEGRVRAWIEAVMAQAVDPEVARTTRAVLWNGGHITHEVGPAAFDSNGVLSELLIAPLTDLPSPDPARDAATMGHAVMGEVRSSLAHGIIPTDADVEHLATFCLAGVGARAATPKLSTRRNRR